MCSPTIGGIAIWNPGIFLARYPEFTGAYNANPSKFAGYFIEAGFYLSNATTSPVQDITRRLYLLNMLVAHISYLNGDLNSTAVNVPASKILPVTSSAPGNFTVPHGLGAVPVSIEILPTSAGLIWAQTPAYDATNVYLAASDTGVSASISLFGYGQIASVGEVRPVGRVSSAGEGSVNATFEDTPATAGNGPWFRQSQYGYAFWQATSSLRGFQYSARPTRIAGRGFGYFG